MLKSKKELSFSRGIMDNLSYRMTTLESAGSGFTSSLPRTKMVSAMLGKGLNSSELIYPLPKQVVRIMHKCLHNALDGQNAQLSSGF